MRQFRVTFKKESQKQPGRFDNFEFFCVADNGIHAATQCRDYNVMVAKLEGHEISPHTMAFVCTPVSD